MSNIALIQPQRQDFRTAQNSAWLDGFPLIAQPGAGGVVAGSLNVGNGGLTIASVDVGAAEGVHVLRITGIVGGLTHLTVTDPDDDVTAEGVVGLPLYAGGIQLTLAQGSTPFAVGDTFAIAVLPVPVDLTGLVFTLDARRSAGAATVSLSAISAPPDGSTPTIVAGTTGGNVAMRLLQSAMARCPPGVYPYNVLAADPVIPDAPVTAFFGVITHAAILQA